MECPNCHFKIEDNNLGCPNCGWKSSNSQPINDFSMDFMPVSKEPVEETIENKIEQNSEAITSYQIDTVLKDNGEVLTIQDIQAEEEKIKAIEAAKLQELNEKEEQSEHEYDEYELLSYYIGNNAERITDEGFSFAAFFLGGLYLVYRKCYGYFFLLLYITIVLSGLAVFIHIPSFIIPIINIVVMIILGIIFKKLYVNHCLDKVRKIMARNKEKTFTEVSQICSKKGGTSIASVVVAVFSMIVLFMVVFLIISMIFFKELIPSLLDGMNILQEQTKNGIVDLNAKNQDMKNYIQAVENGYQKAIKLQPGVDLTGVYTELTSSSIRKNNSPYFISLIGDLNEPNTLSSEEDSLVIDVNGKVVEAHIKFDDYFVSYCNGSLDTNNSIGFTSCDLQ